MDDEIHREPWLSYLKLLEYKKSALAMSESDALWWLLRKAETEHLLYFKDDFAKTVQQAQSKVTEQTPEEIASKLNVFSGMLATINGDYAISINFFNKALSQAKSAGLNIIYIMGKQELAYSRSLTESYDTSLIELQGAYVEAFALEDTFLLATINETYGAIYGYMGEYEQSVEYYKKALDIYEQLGYQYHIAEAIFGLASTYRYWKKYELATAQFELYDKKISYTPNKDLSFYAAYGLGMTLAEKGDCLKAIEVIDSALKLNGMVDYNGELLKRKTVCLITLGQLIEAEKQLEKVKEIFGGFPELDGPTWKLEIIKIESELEHAKGNERAAYLLAKDYYQKYTELLETKSTARFDRVRTAMEIERKDVEISLLQQKAEVQLLQVEQQNQRNILQRYIIFFVVFLILVVLVLLFVQNNYTRKIYALSIKDPLSNLYNRRYIFDYLDKLLARQVDKKSELSVMMVDIDDFKELNNKYGHPFGDYVIEKIGEIGQAILRNDDVMARIGGEEYLCVLPRIEEQQCLLIAQRFLKNVNQYKFTTENGMTLSITVSIGITSLSGAPLDGPTLYTQADEALYHSKQQGKNQVTVYHEITDS